MIQAWAFLQPPDWQLMFMGPGSIKYRQKLFATYKPEGAKFLGEKPHDESLRLMSKADVFALTSHTEGFPNVVLEAMALGKPIVASRVGAIPEMLADGCGLLIEPQDVVGLQSALKCILEDKDLLVDLGSKARLRSIRFSIDVVFAQYMTVWRQTAGL